MRGEYCFVNIIKFIFLGSPPLARGIPAAIRGTWKCIRITPACAGNTSTERIYNLLNRDHPRLRGEYKEPMKSKSYEEGSPPLARGIPSFLFHLVSHFRITPACAGNTHLVMTFVKSHWDHPRLRGEYKIWKTGALQCPGSPPLARGIRRPDVAVPEVRGITPACAGNTRT